MARIGIDGRLWSETGPGRYIRNLVFNLSKIDKKNDYFIFLLKKDLRQKLPKNFYLIEADFRWYTLDEQRKLPNLLDSYHLDLVHFPHFNIPIFYKGKFIVTIHDLIHQKFQMKRATTRNRLFYLIKHRAYNLVFSAALKNSQKIITPSEFIKKDIEKFWKIKGQKITVTYEGVDESIIKLLKILSEDKRKKVLEKFGIRPPFIYYIGNAHPHKNIEGLIKAFQELRKNYQYLTLVLSGKRNYFWNRVLKETKDIIYTDFVTDEEYVAILKSATAYVQPSFEEGFGIPLLEAMAAKTPVVSSEGGSMPEIGGDGALYFDPKKITDMVNKISEVINIYKVRNELIKNGEERVKEFSWQKMARETLEIYQEYL